MTTPTLPDYLREIYNLSPVAINALLLGVGGLNSDERDALMHEFTRPANGPFIRPYTPNDEALFSAAGKVAMWVMAEYEDAPDNRKEQTEGAAA